MVTISAYINGIVITQRVCDTRASPAPLSGSPPYASGKTTVLRPIADALAKKARNSTSLSIERSNATLARVLTPKINATISMGIRRSFIAVTA